MFKLIKSCAIHLSIVAFLSVFVLVSCDDTSSKITFVDKEISTDKDAVIVVNIPEAKGNKVVAEKINKTIQDFVTSAFDIADEIESTEQLSIEEAAKQFDNDFKAFNNQLPDDLTQELPVWEALIDGEIIYKTDALVCIAMNASINTGAINNRTHFEFLNFDLETGKKLKVEDIVENIPEFTKLAKKYYDKEVLTTFDDATGLNVKMGDDEFKLPKYLGFNDDGIVVLFQNLEVPSQDVLEYTIPYEVANDFLKY